MGSSHQHPEPFGGTPSTQQIDLLCRDVELLPALTGTVRRVVDAVRDFPCASDERNGLAQRIAALAECDPALAVRVFSLANARAPQPHCALGAAASSLDPQALAGGMLALPLAEVESLPLPLAEMWKHCQGVALLAERLARRLDSQLGVDPDLARSAGLLHEVGDYALALIYPKAYQRALHAARSAHGDTSRFLRSDLGVDGTTIARRLGERWHLSELMVRGIWLCRHAADSLPGLAEGALANLLGLADTLVRRAEIGFAAEASTQAPPRKVAEKLGLDWEDVQADLEDLPEQVQRQAEKIGLDETHDLTQRSQVLQDCNRQLDRLNRRLLNEVHDLRSAGHASQVLQGLADTLSPESAVPDVLARLGETLSQDPSAAGPVVVYSVDFSAQGRDVLAMCRHSAERQEFACFQLREGARPFVPSASEPLDAVCDRLLAEAQDLMRWIPADGYVHEALSFAHQWVGGVFRPAPTRAAGEQAQRFRHATLDAAGMALGIFQSRARAIRLGEQLASATQEYAQSRTAEATSQALEALGEMAAGAAHEINNPLAVVGGRAQLMRERAQSDQERRVWELIAEQAERISDIFTELMEFASPPAPAPEPVQVKTLLEEACEAFSQSNHPQASALAVDIDIGRGTPLVLVDRGQMRSALTELIANAVGAQEDTPHVTLQAKPDPYSGSVLVLINDPGMGMDEQTLTHAYTPFFSQHPAGRRRGLGLPRAKRFVEINGGRIWILSKPTEGTTVYVKIPAAADRPHGSEQPDGRARNSQSPGRRRRT